MANALPPEKIKKLSVQERASLYANAKKAGTPEGEALAKIIEDLGLPYSEGSCVNMDDPIVVRMYEIIYSLEGRSAAKKAADAGQPALAGVDPMIAEVLGVDYGKHNMTTQTAGAIIADLMREMGYSEAGRSDALPKGCVAKSGQIWDHKIG